MNSITINSIVNTSSGEVSGLKSPTVHIATPKLIMLGFLLLAAILFTFVAVNNTLRTTRSNAAAITQSPERVQYSSKELLIKIKKDSRGRVKEGNPNDTGIPSLDALFKEHRVKRFEKVAKDSDKSKKDEEVFGWYKVTLEGPQEIVTDKRSLKGEENTKEKRDEAAQEHAKAAALHTLAPRLRKDAAIEAVEPNFIVTTTVVPNDPYYSSTGSWGQPYADMWGMKKIAAEQAWDTMTGSASVIVADIDTGVDRNHQDLQDNMWVNTAETSGNGIDDDSNGYIDDYYGWDFVNRDGDPMDDHGHGTHTAGTIAAKGNNALGVVGVNWVGKIMALKFLSSGGSGYLSDGIAALAYAADMGARVSSNSWGCQCNSQAMDDAVAYEHSKGTVVIVAAGNSGADALDFSPASSTFAITVAASDPNDARASFSNRGEKIDVAAPGVDILSTRAAINPMCTSTATVGTNYCRVSGTSMSTPHVAGLAALLIAKDPSLTNEAVRQLIRKHAQDLGAAGRDTDFGYGRIAVSSAIAGTSTQPLTPLITSPLGRGLISGGTLEIRGGIGGPNFASYKVEVGAGRTPPSWTTLATSGTQVGSGVLATVNTAALPAGSITFRLTATSTLGQTYQFQVFDVRNPNDPDLEAGFPVQTISNGGNYHAGPAIHTLVGNIDADSQLEIIVTGLAGGPLYAWNYNGTLVSGWPGKTFSGAEYAALGNLSNTYPNFEVTSGGNRLFTYNGAGQYLSGWPRLVSNYVATPPSLADVTGDGIDEIFTEEEDWKLHGYKADGTILTGWPSSSGLGGQEMHTPAIADINKDGTLEIISVSGWISSGVYVYAYRYDGTVLPGFPVSFPDGFTDTFPVVGDVDDDGNLEIIIVGRDYPDKPLLVHVISSSGIVKRSIALNGNVSYGAAPALADMNGDKIPEIIILADDALHVIKGDGTPLTGWPQIYTGYRAGNSSPVVGDVDGDGQPDIAITLQISSVNGEIRVYNRGGTLVRGFPKFLRTGAGAVPAIADIDLDGRNELIVTGDYWNGVGGEFDKVWVYDLKGAGPYGRIEWGQFGGGPKHQGRYIPVTSPTPTPTPTSPINPTPTRSPTPAPAVSFSNIAVTNITPTQATVTWNTQIPATSRVSYGLSESNLNMTSAENTTLKTSHSVTLTNLSNNTRYYFRVHSKNASQVQYSSSINFFKTRNK